METNGNNGRRRGRPRGGVRRGERLRDYPTFTVRVPPRTRAMIRALCKRKNLPAWALLRCVVVQYVRELPAVERRWVVRRSRPSQQAA